MLCKAFKLLSAYKTTPIGIAADDKPTRGREDTQARARDKFLQPPIVATEFTITLPLPLFNTEKVSGRELKQITQQARRFQVLDGDEEKELFADSAIQSALLKAVNHAISVGVIGVDRHGIVVTDKGPKQRLVWLFKMADGKKIAIYWDVPHLESATMKKVADQWFPKPLKLVLKVRTCAGGVHSVKIGNVLLNAAKDASEQDILDLIGPGRHMVVAQLELSSTSAADMVPAFRVACKQLATQLIEMSAFRWLNRDYAVICLESKFVVLKIAATAVYSRELGGLKPDLQARLTHKTAHGVKHYSYNKEDLKALEFRVANLVQRTIRVGGDGAGAANPQPQGNDNAPGGAVPGGLDLTGAAGTKTKTVVRDGIHKKAQEVKFVNELFLAVNDPDVEMGALCYARISRPVTFQHGCLVGLTSANIEARSAMIRLPVICMHEIGANAMHSPYSRALQLFADTNATKIARRIGSMATEVFAALAKLHMANNAQYQRILQYGSSSVFELGIKDVLLQQDTLPPPVKWLVENVRKFSLTPQLWGWNDGKEVPAVYSLDFWDENKADMGTASRQRMAPAPTTMGKRIPRISVRDWETLVFDECKAAYEEGDGAFEPARKFVKYLLSSPNYYILKEFRKRAQMDSDPDDLLNFLSEILDVRILSTRDIEVTGKKINNASKAANYEGVLQGHCPFYATAPLAPTFLPMMDITKPEAGADENSKKEPLGVRSSWSCLDGREPFPEGTDAETIFGMTTMEEIFQPLPDPIALDNWLRDKIAEHSGTNAGADLSAFLQNAYESAVEHFNNCPAPNWKTVQAHLRGTMALAKDDYEMSQEDLRKMAEAKFNIDFMWRVVIAESVLFEHRRKFRAKSRSFATEIAIGSVQCSILRGVYERLKADDVPPILRVEDIGSQVFFYQVLDVLSSMGVLLVLEMEMVEVLKAMDDLKWRTLYHQRRRAADAKAKADGGERADPAALDLPTLDDAGFNTDITFKQPAFPPTDCKTAFIMPRPGSFNHACSKTQKTFYLNYPTGVGSYSLPLQAGAGMTDGSRIKFHLMQSAFMGLHSDESTESIHVCEAQHVSAGGKFNLIQVDGAEKSFKTILGAGVAMGFGVRDKWIQKAEESSSGAADVQEIVGHLLRESPRLFHRLNSAEAPADWCIGDDIAKYKRHLNNLAAATKPKADDLKEVDGEVDLQEFNRQWEQMAARKDVADAAQGMDEGVHMMDVDEPESGNGIQPGAAVRGTDDDIFEDELPRQRPERLLPADDEDAFIGGARPGASSRVRPQSLLQSGNYISTSATGVAGPSEEDKPLRSRSPRREAFIFPGSQEAILIGNRDGDGLDEPAFDVQQVLQQGIEDGADLRKVAAFGDDVSTHLHVRDDPAKPEVENLDEDLLSDNLHKRSGLHSDIGRMCMYAGRPKLEARQYTEILYCLVWGGQKPAKIDLIKRGLYPASKNSKGSMVITSTMQKTCQEYLMEIQNMIAKDVDALLTSKDQVARDRVKKTAPVTQAPRKPSAKQLAKNMEKAVSKARGARQALGGNAHPFVVDPEGGACEDEVSVHSDYSDPFADVDEDHREYAEVDREAAQNEYADELRKKYTNKSGNLGVEYQEIVSRFPVEMDLIALQAEHGNTTLRIKCSSCGLHLLDTKRIFCGQQKVPRLQASYADDSKTTMCRMLGPHSHMKRGGDQTAPRCFCGYWVSGYLCSDKEGKYLAAPEQYWRCASKFLEWRARESEKVCKCKPPIDNVKKIKCVAPSKTFGKLFKRDDKLPKPVSLLADDGDLM
eukprot:g1908.t1